MPQSTPQISRTKYSHNHSLCHLSSANIRSSSSGMRPPPELEPEPESAPPHLTTIEKIVTVTTRIKNTSACLFIYIMLMLLNIIVMAFEFHGHASHTAILVIESIINLFLLTEVTIGLITLQWGYFKSLFNLIDFALTTLCIVFFIITLETNSTTETMSIVDAILLGLRYCFQLLRLSVLLYRSRKTSDQLRQPDVDFSIHQFTDQLNSNYHPSKSNSQLSFDNNHNDLQLKAQHHSSIVANASILNGLSESRERGSVTGLLFSMPAMHQNALKHFAAEQEKLLNDPSAFELHKIDHDDFSIENEFEDYQV